ncbi:MAG TPA: hypothetical protein VEA69_02845 [Tepidisphaeraceae bacterium]|nr:hypothetical protein [Tepidisphaeraceae bacterium]
MLRRVLALLLVVAFAAPLAAQITKPHTFADGETIDAARMNANFDEFASKAVNREGGTMAGVLAPDGDNTRDLGTSSAAFRTLYLDTSLIAGGTLLTTTAASNRIQVDSDNNGSELFYVRNGSGSDIFSVDEDGDVAVIGSGNRDIAGTTAATTIQVKATSSIRFQIDTDADGTESFYFRNGAGSDVITIDETGTPTLNGELFIAGHTTTGSAANAFIDSANGRVLRSTSTLRAKRDLRDISLDEAYRLLAVRPIAYRSRMAHDGDREFYGFGAEPVAETLPILVDYGTDGQPNYVEYDRVVAPLLRLVQDLERRIRELEAR